MMRAYAACRRHNDPHFADGLVGGRVAALEPLSDLGDRSLTVAEPSVMSAQKRAVAVISSNTRKGALLSVASCETQRMQEKWMAALRTRLRGTVAE
jgi:hypothetical protein